MRTLAAIAASLALALQISPVSASPRKHRAPTKDSAWMRGCIHERTGPTGGIPTAEARKICQAEQPEDEIEAAKAQLRLARANAKVAKAKARVAKAIESCEQAVVDACIEAAKPDGSTDCEDAALRVEYNRVCLAQEGK